MSTRHPYLYLASQSPRRRELLKQIGVHFELLLLRTDARRQVDVDETPRENETPELYVQRLSREKARSGFDALQYRNLQPQPVLAADTTVTLDGKIYGKPENSDHAACMLRELSGREHQVLTAVAIAKSEHIEVTLSTSTVQFAKLDEARIKRYLQTHEYIDKAGGYAIQGQAAAFIERINGSYSGVMGLPLFETVEMLQRFDFPAP
ncbi:MAG TPA: septum formation inhibitor Maf [Gallionella sp.]|jgi:septum formation protein|nr:Maf family protein [Gallionella sp.]OGS66775.1 MAG: septum formation protein Maf [Gallionellales bacterium GWA2_54_124]OGT17839.1 MAG: septum formation protein Maf [Gallionellales bacterium RIFOXYD12_FULL_53_10]HCI53871.1 septum formation inhibitor Maf [Gallionella sp.]